MALIDRYVPRADYGERHQTAVRASSRAILAAAVEFRPESDAFFRRMIAMREWPMRIGHLLGGRDETPAVPFGLDRFTLLERSETELVYGLAGRFWKADYGLGGLADATAFLALNVPGTAKLALNFAIHDDGNACPTLSTETRIVCLDKAARRNFAPYWYMIRPVSGIIRRRTLAAIRLASEDGIA